MERSTALAGDQAPLTARLLDSQAAGSHSVGPNKTPPGPVNYAASRVAEWHMLAATVLVDATVR